MNEHALPTLSDGASMMPMDYTGLLARLGERDRVSLERQVLAYEKKLGVASAQRWRNLASALTAMAPAGVKLAGNNAMQFYIPDGKYRKQVFALQALANGELAVYAPDVRAEAVKAGLLSRRKAAEVGTTYRLARGDDILTIDALDGRTPNPDAFFKDLTGWNRKAIRVTLPAEPSEAQITATTKLCALAATQWT